MSFYGPNFTRESTSKPVSSDNGVTTISYSGRIATREIRETIPLINLRGDLPINLEWKGSTNQPCLFLDREPAYCSIFAKRIKGENDIYSVTSIPMNLIKNFLLALHHTI